MDKTIKVGIISGVIASMVFVYFLDPILRIFGDLAVYLSSIVYEGLWDSIYEKSALGAPRDPALSVFALLSGAMTGLAISLITIYAGRKHIFNRFKKQEASKKPVNFLILTMTVIFICGFLMFKTWAFFAQFQIVTSFNQHIRIVTPYIPQKEKELLISEFSLMKTKANYDAIYEKLKHIVESNHLSLPENPSYDFWSP